MDILSIFRNANADVTSADVKPVVQERDLCFIKQIMHLVKQGETHNIAPRLRTISADDYIIETITASGGRNMLPIHSTHDLRTREGRDSFRDCCQYGLISSLYFLANTNPEERASIFKSKHIDEFHRDDLEPWIGVVGIIRKWDGYIS